MKTNYFEYATVILTIALVYLFGELKYEKKVSKMRLDKLTEEVTEFEDYNGRLEQMVAYLSKQIKEYEALFAVIKLKIEKDKQDKQDSQQPEAKPQSTMPSVPKGYPGIYIPKGQQSPNDLNNPFAV